MPILSHTEYLEFLENLRVGDEIAYGSLSCGAPIFRFDKVKSIPPSRSIIRLENGLNFNKNGRCKVEKYSVNYGSYLEPIQIVKSVLAEHEAQKDLRLKRSQLKTNLRILIDDNDAFSLEQLEELTVLVKKFLKP